MSVLSALTKIGQWDATLLSGNDGDPVATFGPATSAGTPGVLKLNQLNGNAAVRFVHNSTIYQFTNSAFRTALAAWGAADNAAFTNGATLIRVVKPASVADFNWLLFYDDNGTSPMRFWPQLDSRDPAADRFAIDFADPNQQGYRGSTASADNFNTPGDVLYLVVQIQPYVPGTSVVKFNLRVGTSTSTVTATIANNGALTSVFRTGSNARDFFLYGFGGDDFYGALAPSCVNDSDANQILVDLQAKFAGGGGSDTTAPTLSSATVTVRGKTNATATVNTNEANGTLYGVATTTSTPPTAAQVEAGQNAAGTAAVSTANLAVTSTGTKLLSFTGLAAATTYYVHFAHKDAAGNRSAVVSTASFVTPGQTMSAGWTAEPFQTFTGTLRVGVLAYQTGGGESVEFRVNGGSAQTVSAVAYNPDSTVFERFITLAAADYADGPITVDAIARSTSGGDIQLPTLTLNANGGGTLVEHDYYFGPAGNDANPGTSGSPFATLLGAYQAVYAARSGVMDGVNLNGLAGATGALGSVNHNAYANATTSRPVTVRAAPGVARSAVVITSTAPNGFGDYQGFNTSIVRVQGITLNVPFNNRAGYISHLILKDVSLQGLDRTASDFTFANFTRVYAIDVRVDSAKRAIQGAVLARGVRGTNIGESFLHDCIGVAANCGCNLLDPGTGIGTLHPDFYQFTADPGNAIAYGLVGREIHGTYVRMQPSATGVAIDKFEAKGTAAYGLEFERPYADVLLRSFTSDSPYTYADGNGFTASNLKLENVSFAGSPPASHSGVTLGTPARAQVTITPSGGAAIDQLGSTSIGATATGTALAKAYTISNAGDGALRIGEVKLFDAVTGQASTDWDVTASPASTIAAAGSSTLTLRLKSTAATGDHATRVVVYNDASGFSEFVVSATAAVVASDGPGAVTFDFNLTSAAIGKTDLSVTFYNASFSIVGTPSTTGFHGWDDGQFTWSGTPPVGYVWAECTSATLPIKSRRTSADAVGAAVTLPSSPPDGYGGSEGSVSPILGAVVAQLPAGADLRRRIKIVVAQGESKLQSIEVVDALRAPVDLTPFDALRFVVFAEPGGDVAQFEGAAITKDSDTTNRCYVQIGTTATAAAGGFLWALWSLDDPDNPQELGRGPFNVDVSSKGT